MSNRLRSINANEKVIHVAARRDQHGTGTFLVPTLPQTPVPLNSCSLTSLSHKEGLLAGHFMFFAIALT